MLPQFSVTMTAQMLFSILKLIFSFPGDLQAHAHVPYDYSFTPKCLATPLEPQYGGGIAVNPELNHGSKGWTQVGTEKVEICQGKHGNNFIVANRSAVMQTFQLEADKLYTFSAWVQSSCGDAFAKAMFDTGITNITAGWVTTQDRRAVGQCSKGDNSSVADIWVDNISLQPFTQDEWKSHQDQSVEKVRKSRVIFKAVDKKGRPVSNATISIIQTRPYFPFGNVMNNEILDNPKYQNWFTSRFKYTVFENEMKWPFVNSNGNIPDYSTSDAMLEFAKFKGLAVRGHTVHCGNYETLPSYLQRGSLDPVHFRAVADAHTDSIVSRYRGQLIHWDVVNENVRPNFFESFVGENASALQYQKVHSIDRKPLLFLNEFQTIEKSEYGNMSSAWKYLHKVWQIRKQGYNGPLAIGLQGHFNELNLPYIRSSIDIVQSANLPVWVTELDVSNATAGNVSNVAVYLEHIMREIHAHRAVKGLMMWSAISKYRPGPSLCYKMCLTDSNFLNLPTGDVVDAMLAEWTHAPGVEGTTNNVGRFKTSLFHGEYEAVTSNLVTGNPSKTVKFKLKPGEEGDAPLLVKIYVNQNS